MSFVSALPANLPKFQVVTPLRRSSDGATGFEYVATLVRILTDTVATHERYTPYRYHEEVARAVELLAMTIHALDHGIGISAVPTRIFSLRDRVADASYVRTVAREHGDVTYGDDLFTVGYPTEESPTQDLSRAYLRASQQLSTLRDGRYAYAQDWNVLADYAKAIINVFSDQFAKLYRRGYRQIANLYYEVSECHRILSTYKYLQSGDVIMPEHTNTLIDVARCLNLAVSQLLTKAIVEHSEKDETTGLERSRIYPLIILVDTDDWETASEWIVDGTVVFVNYGTFAMTPDEVFDIVENKEVVFAVLIDTQPHYRAPAGAFYEVFYDEWAPRPCAPSGPLLIRDESFMEHLGFTDCRAYSDIITHIDYQVRKEDKRPDIVLYVADSLDSGCGYSYIRYRKGAIIEMPFDGTWGYLDRLDWSIGAIARVLLGEPNNCYIAFNNVKLRHIVWMAGYRTSLLQPCMLVDMCMRILASRAGLPVIDLRKRH